MTDNEKQIVAYTGGPASMGLRGFYDAIKGTLGFHGIDVDEDRDMVTTVLKELEVEKTQAGVMLKVTFELMPLHDNDTPAHTNI